MGSLLKSFSQGESGIFSCALRLGRTLRTDLYLGLARGGGMISNNFMRGRFGVNWMGGLGGVGEGILA